MFFTDQHNVKISTTTKKVGVELRKKRTREGRREEERAGGMVRWGGTDIGCQFVLFHRC